MEQTVIVSSVKAGLLGKNSVVSARSGKLANSVFASRVGLHLDSDVEMAIDYYGLIKKSSRLLAELHVLGLLAGQLKSLETTVVFFPTVTEKVVEVYSVGLAKDFLWFKTCLLKYRGFKKWTS